MSADDGVKIFNVLYAAFGPVGVLTICYAGWVTFQREKLLAGIVANMPAQVASQTSIDQTLSRVVAIMERVSNLLDKH